MHHLTDKIVHTTSFVTPVVGHWLKRDITQWVQHERTLFQIRDDLGVFPYAYQPIKTENEITICYFR